jgi:peptidyl-prolyl cis-trans isomerase A (cyclophilin A)
LWLPTVQLTYRFPPTVQLTLTNLFFLQIPLPLNQILVRMSRIPLLCFLLISLSACHSRNTDILMETGAGSIKIELYKNLAPLTVENFLKYVDSGRYNGSHFYRVVTPDNQPGKTVKIEVVQGGLQLDEDIDTIPGILHENTSMTGIHHLDGTISMARDTVGSASTEFFICIGPQPELDLGGKRNPDGQGFAAFGKVFSGMEVIRHIQQMPADSVQYLLEPVIINRITRLR